MDEVSSLDSDESGSPRSGGSSGAAAPTPGSAGAAALPSEGGARALVFVALVLAAAVALAYSGGLRGEFLGADDALFERSPFVTVPSQAEGAGPILPEWVPRFVTVLSLAADRALWGPLPAWFRTTNVALHFFTALLLFILLRRLSGKLHEPAAAALLFAVHPVHAETVDVVGHRGEILGTIFMLGALLLLARAREGPAGAEARPGPTRTPGQREIPPTGDAPGQPAGSSRAGMTADWADSPWRTPPAVERRSRRSVALAGACLAALIGSFATPMALLLPVLVALHDWLGESGWRRAAARHGREWALLAAAALPSLVVHLVVSPPIGAENPWLAGRSATLSLLVLFIPYPFRVYRILGPAWGADLASVLAIGLALALLLGLLALCRAKARGIAAVDREHHLGIVLLTVPVAALALIPPAAQGPDIPFPFREALLYLPSAGACWVLVALIRLGASLAGARSTRTARRTALAAAGAAIVLFGLLLNARHQAFASDAVRFAAAASQTPRSEFLRLQLARAAAERGQTEAAIRIVTALAEQRPEDADLRLLLGNLQRDVRDPARRNLEAAERETLEALRLDPRLASAHLTLGLIARERGDIAGAEAAYREAIRLEPALAEAHSNLGALLAKHGSADEALEELQRAVQLDPSLGDAAANLATFLLDQKRPEEAEAVLRKALRYSEANARLHYNLGVVLQRTGRSEEAMHAYGAAIRYDPGYARPINNLAVLYAEHKRFEEAASLLERLVELEPANERAHFNLGIAYRALGRNEEAAARFAAALRIRPDYAEASRALTDLAQSPRDQP